MPGGTLMPLKYQHTRTYLTSMSKSVRYSKVDVVIIKCLHQEQRWIRKTSDFDAGDRRWFPISIQQSMLLSF